jgi:hypothetical protein
MLKDFRLSFIGKIAFHNKQNGVADSGYESTFRLMLQNSS